MGATGAILTEIATRFPQLKIEGSYSDPMYPFAGDLVIQDGKIDHTDRTKEIEAEMEAFMADVESKRGDGNV
jgi:hypothetical protein